jgi:hypothetical protein
MPELLVVGIEIDGADVELHAVDELGLVIAARFSIVLDNQNGVLPVA